MESTRIAYTMGQTPLVDLLDAKRSLIELRRTLAEFRVDREKSFADLEAAAGAPIESRTPSR